MFRVKHVRNTRAKPNNQI